MRSSIRLLILFQCLFLVQVHAQKTLLYADPLKNYHDAQDLFSKEKYGAAQELFSQTIASTTDIVIRTDAEFYHALCALELDRADAPNLLIQFTSDHPESPKVGLAAFYQARYYFRSRDLKKTIQYLNATKQDLLTSDQLLDYRFMSGYSYFQQKEYNKARPFFSQLSGGKNKYSTPSNYYLGYILFTEKKYDAALKYFLPLHNNKQFSATVPIYIAQIYYTQGKYEQVIRYSDTITNTKVQKEILSYVGKSQYHLGNYEKAEPLLEQHHASGTDLIDEDHYELGYTYFRNKKYDKAYPELSKISNGTSEMNQTANFILGNCFLALNKKENARIAFLNATKSNADAKIKEKSLFNYARLSYEMAFQNDAVKSLQQFIENYPNSENTDEAKGLLSQLFLTTKNYKEAIELVESIKNKNLALKQAYQKLTFYRAQELFRDKNYTEALAYFKKSLTNDYDKLIKAYCYYYMGEMNYKGKRYDEAIADIKRFQSIPEAQKTVFGNNALYNLAYCYFQKKEYETALGEFNHYLQIDNYYDKTPEIYLDAHMRAADCNFMLKHYDAAVDNYDYVISKRSASSDYALYQRGNILGLQNKLEEKVNSMKRIAKEYPKSELNDDAIYAIAETRNQQGQYENAIKAYEFFIENFPRSSLLSKVYLNLGAAYRNFNKPDEAVAAFKTVVEKYPGTDEAKEALNGIHDLMVENGKVTEYITYLRSLNRGSVTTAQEDSVMYEAAAVRWEKRDCKVSMVDFDNYVTQFPNGIFIVKANYYLADCAFKEQEYPKALKAYEFLMSTGRSDYMENSYRNAAFISYNNKNYEKALLYYTELEKYANGKENIVLSYIGQMRSANNLGKKTETMEASKKLLNYDKATGDQKTEAHLYCGRIYYTNGELNKAMEEFSAVLKTSKNVMGAEAKYHVALIQFQNKDYKSCKKTVLELNDQFASYNYWVAKGFIVLGDAYVAQGDYFQARDTYQSVAENVDDAELKAIATQRIADIEGKE